MSTDIEKKVPLISRKPQFLSLSPQHMVWKYNKWVLYFCLDFRNCSHMFIADCENEQFAKRIYWPIETELTSGEFIIQWLLRFAFGFQSTLEFIFSIVFFFKNYQLNANTATILKIFKWDLLLFSSTVFNNS